MKEKIRSLATLTHSLWLAVGPLIILTSALSLANPRKLFLFGANFKVIQILKKSETLIDYV